MIYDFLTHWLSYLGVGWLGVDWLGVDNRHGQLAAPVFGYLQEPSVEVSVRQRHFSLWLFSGLSVS